MINGEGSTWEEGMDGSFTGTGPSVDDEGRQIGPGKRTSQDIFDNMMKWQEEAIKEGIEMGFEYYQPPSDPDQEDSTAWIDFELEKMQLELEKIGGSA